MIRDDAHDKQCEDMRRKHRRTAAIRQAKTEREQFNLLEIDITELIKNLHDKEFRDEFLSQEVAWTIRTQVKAMRLDRGWTQEELAEKAGLSYATINRIENLSANDCDISIKSLRKVAKAFDVALFVRFEAWSKLIQWLRELQQSGIKSLIPKTFADEMERLALEEWAAQENTT